MKTILTFIYFTLVGLAIANEPIETILATLKEGDTTFKYVRVNRGNQIEWELRQDPTGEIILKFNQDLLDRKSSIYTFSNLIDVIRDGDQCSALFSLDIGMLYVRCRKAEDGLWAEIWRQSIIGATNSRMNITAIELKKIDSVWVTSRGGNHSEFVISKDKISKDGLAFKPQNTLSIKSEPPEEQKKHNKAEMATPKEPSD